MKLKLQKLFAEHNIQSISFNSKKIGSNAAFFAIRGTYYDGNEFVEEAINNGALIVFSDDLSKTEINKVYFVENARLALALAAGIIHHQVPENLIAVTGTNGKSSVVSYVHQILTLLGKSSACMGTLGVECNRPLEELIDTNQSLTTNDPINFRILLEAFAKSNIKNVSFEASSHGICQKRLGDVKAKTAAFTSFSQDHLDYHRTMESYLQAKLMLFLENLMAGGDVVLNSEISYYDFITNFLQRHKISYTSVGKSGDVKIINNIQTIGGQSVFFSFQGVHYNFCTDIVGSFQASNLLIAAKLVANLGINFADIISVLDKIKAVKGRMQRITALDSIYQVFVDYAHTPDALKQSLQELKMLKQSSGRLFVIFGCGGDRDKSKRPIMGKIAAEIADCVIITDDNPRDEDASNIRQEILMGISNMQFPHIQIIADRKQAIMDIVASLNHFDVLLVAGKGHEDYQIIGSQMNKFSDIKICQIAIEKANIRKNQE